MFLVMDGAFHSMNDDENKVGCGYIALKISIVLGLQGIQGA